MRKKGNNKKGFTIIEIAIGLTIAMVVLNFGYNAGYKFYKNVQDKAMSEQIKFKINQVITSNDVGRGIKKDRIKANNIVFRNNSNIIDNYYYKEAFKVDPVTMIQSPVPTIEFYGMERLKFDDDIKFSFPTNIEGKDLLFVPSDNTERLIINRIKPNNQLLVFDGSDNFFQTIDPDDATFFRSDFTFGKGTKTLIKGRNVDSNFYYDIKKGTIPTNFINTEITVTYKGKEIGKIITDKNTRKLIYVSHFDDVSNIKGLTD